MHLHKVKVSIYLDYNRLSQYHVGYGLLLVVTFFLKFYNNIHCTLDLLVKS